MYNKDQRKITTYLRNPFLEVFHFGQEKPAHCKKRVSGKFMTVIFVPLPKKIKQKGKKKEKKGKQTKQKTQNLNFKINSQKAT